MKRTSGKRWISLVLALCLCLLVGCGGKQTGYDPLKGVETRMITDSAGRQVEIPAEITRIAPSGSTAQMILMPVAYDLLVPCNAGNASALTLPRKVLISTCRDHFRLQLESDLHSADTRTGFHLLRLSVTFSDELLSSSLPFAKNLVFSIDSESKNVKSPDTFIPHAF